jgi:hypothetical protein
VCTLNKKIKWQHNIQTQKLSRPPTLTAAAEAKFFSSWPASYSFLFLTSIIGYLSETERKNSKSLFVSMHVVIIVGGARPPL